MALGTPSNPNNLPGIVTDQPEIYESDPTLSDDTGINDLENNDQRDEAITLIEVPTKQAFAYFAERENEIAQFYVQRYGEYKLSSEEPDQETDIEKYHRLVSEVNQLLLKFRSDSESDKGTPISGLTNNLEFLSKQLKALEFAAEDGSLNPAQAGYLEIKSKLENFKKKLSSDSEDVMTIDESTSHLIRMSALERRLNIMESLIGKNDDKAQNVFKTTHSDNLLDAVDTLGSWASLSQQDNLQRVSSELDYLAQRLEKLNDKAQVTAADSSSRCKLEQLYNLVTATDKQRAMVPTILHRLNAMEELQRDAAKVVTTVNYLEQVQSQIVEKLQFNKGELKSLTEMFSKNIDLIKQFSKDIDSRIAAIKERDE